MIDPILTYVERCLSADIDAAQKLRWTFPATRRGDTRRLIAAPRLRAAR